jgi:hypothetical protein
MFGHGCPLVEPDFWLGVVVLVDGEAVLELVLAAEVDGVLAAVVEPVLVAPCVLGAAAAPVMPAAAPPVASAPATMVAPRSLEMVIGVEPPESVGDVPTMVGGSAKRAGGRGVGVP